MVDSSSSNGRGKASAAVVAGAAAPALEVRDLRKVYGGTVALAGVSLTVRPGEVHSLVGENGAGKSTLVRQVAGIERPDGGAVSFFGKSMPPGFGSPQVREAGVAFIHQDLALVQELTVAENVALVSGYPRRGRLIDWQAAQRRAREAIATMGVDLDPRELVASLPVALQAIVAIARALALNARLIVLDEPTANLSAAEADELYATIRRLRAGGVASVLISHRLDEVLEVSDRVTVFRDGEVVASLEAAGMSKGRLLGLMLGHEPPQLSKIPRHESNVARVRLERARCDGLDGLDLTIAEGEILGLTGLVGAGHHALAELLFGLRPILGGEVYLDGSPLRPRSTSEAVGRGIAFVPADRKLEGAAPHLSLRENLYLNPWRSRVIGPREERREAQRVLEDFDVRPPRTEAEFATLSGGNAQKVVLARCLTRRPRLLILSEPTAAVDVGARMQIHQRLREARAAGASVLLVSSDLEEVAEVSDRVAVLSRGRLTYELHGEEITIENIRRAIHGDN